MMTSSDAGFRDAARVSAGLITVLQRKRETTIVLVAQDLAHWQAGEITVSANGTAAALGFRLVSLDFHRLPERESSLLQAIQQADVAGVAFLWDHSPENLELYAQIVRARPCIQILDPKPIEGLDFVGMDDFAGAQLATQHLISLGHRQIGHVTLRTTMQCVGERRRGYEDALGQSGLSPHEQWTLEVPYGLAEINRSERIPEILRFLSQPHRPRALFVCADWLASEVVECAQELGLSIPDDLAIVGYDDAPAHSLTGVPLTTVHTDRRDLGRLAVEQLVARIRGRDTSPARRTLVTPTLIVRESSSRHTVTAQRWAAVGQYIQDNFRRELPVHEVASMIGLDPHYFSHLFAQVFGRRFTEFIGEMRLQAATELLITTDRTVEWIAYDVGFGSVNHFYSVFKRAYGVAPHAYRKQRTIQPVA